MAGFTTTEIANMAIKHLGHSSPMQELDTDKSAAAHACRIFYQRALNAVLRDFNWPFASTILELQTSADVIPGDHYKYVYQYPPDCARFIKIQSEVRQDSRYSKVPFRIVKGTSGKIILTNKEDAIGEYTQYMDNPAYYDDDFALALSWRLAVYIAPSITGGDPFKLQENAMQMYGFELGMARENALNEMTDDDEAPSELELSRL